MPFESALLAWVLAAALFLYLAVIAPFLGRRAYPRLMGGEVSRPRYYTALSAEMWVWAAVAILIVALSPAIGAADIGIKEPADPGVAYGALLGLPLGMLPVVLLLRWLGNQGVMLPWHSGVSGLMARTPRERGPAVMLAVSAGVCEEVVFRGLLIGLGRELGLYLPVAAAVSVAVFAIGHIYQGPVGTLMAVVSGAGLTLMYLRTGSLVTPIGVHIMIDIIALVLIPHPGRVKMPAPAKA
ncbi:CPBP family intramembrane glutamic endopeptidase [Nonomuraea sp. CA-141351]|uniref:CPBP family intramembrane glutamic endopeptidase n=1 Tax=Nonomuraea sp. CA-141351 TaxID=3239996 RepID=UPI003D902BB7